MFIYLNNFIHLSRWLKGDSLKKSIKQKRIERKNKQFNLFSSGKCFWFFLLTHRLIHQKQNYDDDKDVLKVLKSHLRFCYEWAVPFEKQKRAEEKIIGLLLSVTNAYRVFCECSIVTKKILLSSSHLHPSRF